MNIAFIPVRGGSKSIPLKNIRPIAGKPLVWWTAKAANDCDEIDAVCVSTDNEMIRKTVESMNLPKVFVVDRSKETASDTASTESAMVEFARDSKADNIVLIQATSPLLTAKDLSAAFEVFNREDIDSVLSVVRQKRFLWEENDDGTVHPTNYDYCYRPRRQNFDGFFVENGAFYITSRKALLETNNRLSGRIGYFEMPIETYMELDEPSDWEIVEQLLAERNGVFEEGSMGCDFSKVKMFLTDCDGCLTDGGMYYTETGDEMKKFNTRDGYAFRMLQERGVITGLITSEDRELNIRRAEKLHMDEVIQGTKNKAEEIRELCCKYDIPKSSVLFVGDDLNDLEAIKMVGFGCCPNDAVPQVKEVSKVVTKCKGGDGVIRELAELVLKGVDNVS